MNFLEKANLKKVSREQHKHEKLPNMQRVKEECVFNVLNDGWMMIPLCCAHPLRAKRSKIKGQDLTSTCSAIQSMSLNCRLAYVCFTDSRKRSGRKNAERL